MEREAGRTPGARAKRAALALLALTGCGALVARHEWKPDDPYRPPAMNVPANNASTPARVLLGKTLFFDPRLSGSQWISCATCHNPGLGWSDALPTSIGVGMKTLKRASPTLVNVGYLRVLQWDARSDSLETQALGPMKNPEVMDVNVPKLLERLSGIAGYRAMFESAYPGEGITAETVGKALAAFERTITSTDTPFDRWRRGDEDALSPAAKRGFEVFAGKGDCAVCHEGFNFTDDGVHAIGLRPLPGRPEDVGRFAQRPLASLRGAFKTPTLRDVERTAPYMHDGRYATLEEVVDHYDRGGDAVDNLDAKVKPLRLAAGEKADLVEFLKSLTSPAAEVPFPPLPVP